MSSTLVISMANAKPEETEHSIWQGYGLQPHLPTLPHLQSYDASFHPAPLSNPQNGRSQKGRYPTMEIPALQTRPVREENAVLTASPPSLNSHHSYPPLKRPYEGGNEGGYAEGMQDYREEVPEMQKPNINQDHRLLNFGRLPDKHTLVDSQGRVKQIELVAQIHGMFFLSELATPAGENSLAQPELTCYRRNLFQISGNVTAPRSPTTVITDRGERIPLVSLEVSISATESVDNHVVKLIVIPWKTPPPNSPEIPAGQEHEPTPIQLVAFEEGADAAKADAMVFPIAYRRLQFRIATANNGRRRELQQHFMLHLNVVGTLANGAKINVCENSTVPIVVRGRSPRNFQARKEIPLVGSSSARGHPQELHSTTHGMAQSPVAQRRESGVKTGTVEPPRSSFTFDSSTLSGSPSLVRQASYPQWSMAQQSQNHHQQSPLTPDQQPNSASSTQAPPPSYTSSVLSLDTYLQPTHISNSNSNTHQRFATMPVPMPAAVANRPQYMFPSPLPQYQDPNPRPAKSPRHQAPPELPSIYSSATNLPPNDFRYAAPYSSSGGGLPPIASAITTTGSEYFPIAPPTSMPIPMSMSMAPPAAWSSAPTAGNQIGYGAALPGIAEGATGGGSYEYAGGQTQGQGQNSHGSYVKNESTSSAGPGAGAGGGGGGGGSGGEHYSWSQS